MEINTETNEIKHVATDSETNAVVPFMIVCDHHGMTVEFPNGGLITIDLSGGVVSVYHNKDSDDTGRTVCKIII
jgi:hypothetical protein